MLNENLVIENNSKDFISNMKDTVDVTLVTDDDKQIKAHKNHLQISKLSTLQSKSSRKPSSRRNAHPNKVF